MTKKIGTGKDIMVQAKKGSKQHACQSESLLMDEAEATETTKKIASGAPNRRSVDDALTNLDALEYDVIEANNAFHAAWDELHAYLEATWDELHAYLEAAWDELHAYVEAATEARNHYKQKNREMEIAIDELEKAKAVFKSLQKKKR